MMQDTLPLRQHLGEHQSKLEAATGRLRGIQNPVRELDIRETAVNSEIAQIKACRSKKCSRRSSQQQRRQWLRDQV
eukprot:6492626-Pyramimonas_sp.AAC.1